MANFNMSFPYEVRKGLAVSNLVAQAIGCSTDLGAVGPGYLLSIKESNRKEWEDGDRASTDVTVRYENGVVVRVPLEGWNDTHYGFQWEAGAATVRFFFEEACRSVDSKAELRLGGWRDVSRIAEEIRAKARRAGFSGSQRKGQKKAQRMAEGRPPRPESASVARRPPGIS